MPIALLALTLSAFAIGTTEFVIVGLIPTVAADLGIGLPRRACWSASMRWALPLARRCSPPSRASCRAKRCCSG